MFQRIRQILFLGANIGGHIGQYLVFAQVILDDARDVSVDHFVIGNARAGRVRQGHAAFFIGIDYAGYSQHGIRPESARIEKIIIDAPVNHIHSLEAFSGAHANFAVSHHQIPAFHQFNAHLLG